MRVTEARLKSIIREEFRGAVQESSISGASDLFALASLKRSRSRRLVREQDEAEVRRFNFETMDINALNGQLIWDVLAELQNEDRLRDALKNSWGTDKDERAVAAQKYIWERVFDGGRREYSRWVVYLPTDKITYEGATLKELGVRELRVEVGMAGTPGTRINPMPAPKAYWWPQYFATSYTVYGLLPVKYSNRYKEVWLGDLRTSRGFIGGAVGPEAAINGVAFYFSDKGKEAIEDLSEQFEEEKKWHSHRSAAMSKTDLRSDETESMSESYRRSIVKRFGRDESNSINRLERDLRFLSESWLLRRRYHETE